VESFIDRPCVGRPAALSGSVLKIHFRRIVKYECRTTEVENQSVVYWEAGDGAPLLLMHGTGPGASTLGYWNDVLEPLAEHFHVIAYDPDRLWSERAQSRTALLRQ
jgi:hypothetical protein